jgi:hypothetical protein
MSVKRSRRWMRCGKKSVFLRAIDKGYEPKPQPCGLMSEGVMDYEDELEDEDMESAAVSDACRYADYLDSLDA